MPPAPIPHQFAPPNHKTFSNFNTKFNDGCLGHCKSAFTTIPIVSCFLILGIVAALHWAPFHKKTLKKPGFIIAFLFSVILVAINLGQIVSILVPIINPNASPDANLETDKHLKCGYAAEFVALGLIIGSSLLSALIAAFVIRLYAIRVKYQDDHIHDLDMGSGRPPEGMIKPGVKTQFNKSPKQKGGNLKIPMAGQKTKWANEDQEKGWGNNDQDDKGW